MVVSAAEIKRQRLSTVFSKQFFATSSALKIILKINTSSTYLSICHVSMDT